MELEAAAAFAASQAGGGVVADKTGDPGPCGGTPRGRACLEEVLVDGRYPRLSLALLPWNCYQERRRGWRWNYDDRLVLTIDRRTRSATLRCRAGSTTSTSVATTHQSPDRTVLRRPRRRP